MSTFDLTDHFLISMPGMMDPVFSKCLMYICEHNERGALGLVVNRPIAMSLAAMLGEVGIDSSREDLDKVPVYFGGPVEMERGFVLHEPVGQWQSTISVTHNMGLTTSRDILQSMGQGSGPQHVLVALGYSGWAPGQLEHELSQNAWLSTKASSEILFGLTPEERLFAALRMLGIDWTSLSESVGHG
ncbi:MAG: YqgE/AlgH family protein [Burkholderiales bacterium]|nr:YqgE/AlgH family protein [Burkholderiales bacterium]